MAHVSDPSIWWHEDQTGVFGPECDPLRASICSRAEVARLCSREVAEAIAEWTRDEGRPFRADPNLPQPSRELRSRLAKIRRVLSSFGLNIRRDRGRRWWYLYLTPPTPARGSPFRYPLRPPTEEEKEAARLASVRDSFTPRARELVRLRKGARRRIRFEDAVDAVLDGIMEGLDDSIPF